MWSFVYIYVFAFNDIIVFHVLTFLLCFYEYACVVYLFFLFIDFFLLKCSFIFGCKVFIFYLLILNVQITHWENVQQIKYIKFRKFSFVVFVVVVFAVFVVNCNLFFSNSKMQFYLFDLLAGLQFSLNHAVLVVDDVHFAAMERGNKETLFN